MIHRHRIRLSAGAVCLLVVFGTAAVAQTGPPTIEVTPPWAQAGSPVTVDGTGFFDPAECGPVAISLAASEGGETFEVARATPGPDGSFTTQFNAPSSPVGSFRVVADQTTTDCNASDSDFLDTFVFQVDPDSGLAGSTAQVSVEGYPDVEECGPVVLRFDGKQITTFPTTGFPGDPRTSDFTVPDLPPGTYPVEGFQDGCGTRNGVDTFQIVLPPPTEEPTEPATGHPTDEATEEPTENSTERPTRPTLTIDPGQGPIETPAEAVGVGFLDGVPVEIRFEDVDATPAGTVVVSDATFTAGLVVPTGIPGGPSTVTACQRCGTAGERSATTVFLVTPQLTVDPSLSSPGFVVLARGDGFPAGSQVVLTWAPGLGATATTVDTLGLLEAQVLVLHRDQLGPRDLVATVVDADAVPVTAPFLVVPGTVQPRAFSSRR